MITAYVRSNGTLNPVPVEPHGVIPEEVVWIDLVEPTPEEERLVDESLGLDVAPGRTPVTFVLVGHRLLTLRYATPLPFRVFAAKARRHAVPSSTGEEVLAGLLDAIVDRVADILERVQGQLDTLSGEIFVREQEPGKIDFDEVLRRVGRNHALNAQARESLVSIARLLSFLGRPSDTKQAKNFGRGFKTISRDVMALSVFLPPTLIASIYGMNFRIIPELNWTFGYPWAIGLMILSAVLPYWYFKRRGWL